MTVSEHPLLNDPHLMLTILKTSADGPAGIDDFVRHLTETLQVAREHPDVSLSEVRASLGKAQRRLHAAGLIEDEESGGRVRLSERGRVVMRQHPKGVDDSVLMQFPEFRRFIERECEHYHTITDMPPDDPRTAEYDVGYFAYKMGKTPADNPFEPDTIKHQAWENGWFEARDLDHG